VAGLAVAAAAVLVFLLVPPRWTPPPVPAQSPSAPVGLPRHLPWPTAWTPSVTESPIGRASLLLLVAEPDGDWGELGGTLVVSADGTKYRRVPGDWSEIHLTGDGRRLVYQVPEEGPFPHASVHVLDLADGHERVVALPDALFSRVDRLVLAPDDRTVYAVGSDGIRGTDDDGSRSETTWKVDILTGAVTRVPERPFVIRGDGSMFAWPEEDAQKGRGVQPLPAALAPEGIVLSPVPSPDGQAMAMFNQGLAQPDDTITPRGMVIVRDGVISRWAIDGRPRNREVDLVAWGASGLLYVWDDELRSLDPRTGRTSVVITLQQRGAVPDGREGRFRVEQVAGWAGRSGLSVPGVTEQSEPAWPMRAVWQPHGGVRPLALIALAVLALGGGIVVRLRRTVPAPPS
jgi:hypothetical protein